MARLSLPLIAGLLLLPLVSWAAPPESASRLPFSSQHQAGIRLGVWSNRGGHPPASDSANTFKSGFNDENFFFEGFYARRLLPVLMLEGSLGIVNRGSVTVREAGAENVGSVQVYSLLISAKIYPLGMFNFRPQPFIAGGGGVYHGRRTVQFTTSYDYYGSIGGESETDVSYVIGGGIDWPLSQTIGLDLQAKFMSISFSDRLFTIKNYDALAFLIGVKYLYPSNQ